MLSRGRGCWLTYRSHSSLAWPGDCSRHSWRRDWGSLSVTPLRRSDLSVSLTLHVQHARQSHDCMQPIKMQQHQHTGVCICVQDKIITSQLERKIKRKRERYTILFKK